jgi:poly(3-hydroxyalkanoate) synthetase
VTICARPSLGRRERPRPQNAAKRADPRQHRPKLANTRIPPPLSTYALDWIGATARTKDATIDDYLDVIERAIDRIGDPVNFIGDCQGGWLATVYAALRPEPINTLTIAGARVDLGRVECQLNLLAGAPDHITPPDQVFALADCASTPVGGHRAPSHFRRPPRAVHGS